MKQFNNLSFRWEETEYGCFLQLPLYNVYITRKKSRKYKIEIGNYVHDEGSRNLNKSKIIAIKLIQEIINYTYLNIQEMYENNEDTDLEAWKHALFG